MSEIRAVQAKLTAVDVKIPGSFCRLLTAVKFFKVIVYTSSDSCQKNDFDRPTIFGVKRRDVIQQRRFEIIRSFDRH